MPELFELTNLLMCWLEEKYPGKYSCLEEHHAWYYDVITNNKNHTFPVALRDASKEILFVGKDKIWLYHGGPGQFTIVPAADKAFLDKIEAHINKYQL